MRDALKIKKKFTLTPFKIQQPDKFVMPTNDPKTLNTEDYTRILRNHYSILKTLFFGNLFDNSYA